MDRKLIVTLTATALTLPLPSFAYAEIERDEPHTHVEVIEGPQEATLLFLGVPSITGNFDSGQGNVQAEFVVSGPHEFFAAPFVGGIQQRNAASKRTIFRATAGRARLMWKMLPPRGLRS